MKTEPGVPEATYEGQKKAKPSSSIDADEKTQKLVSQINERVSDLKTENDKLKAKLFKLKTKVKSAKKYKKKYKKAKKEIKRKENQDEDFYQELVDENKTLKTRVAELEDETEDEADPDQLNELETELAEVKEVRDDTFAAYTRARKDNKLLSGMYTWREWVVPEQKRQLIELETELADVKEVRDDTFAELMRAKKDHKRLTEQNGEWKARMFFTEEDNKQYQARNDDYRKKLDVANTRIVYTQSAMNDSVNSQRRAEVNFNKSEKEKTELENQLIEAAKFRTQIGYEKDDAKAVLQTQLDERVQMDMVLVSENEALKAKLSTAMSDIAPLKKRIRDYGWIASSQKYEIRDLKEELSEAKKKLIDLRNESEDVGNGWRDALDDSKVIANGLRVKIAESENQLIEAAKFRTSLCYEKDDKIAVLQAQLDERVQLDLTKVSESAQLATAMSDVKDHQTTIRTLTKMIAGSST